MTTHLITRNDEVDPHDKRRLGRLFLRGNDIAPCHKGQLLVTLSMPLMDPFLCSVIGIDFKQE